MSRPEFMLVFGKRPNEVRIYDKVVEVNRGVRRCPNCNALLLHNDSGHYVGPSLGDEGFWTCEAAT